jgi:gas vesicle protein
MSDFSSGNEVVSSSEGGVTIEKSFDGEEFAVPAIRFELRSEHDDAVTVRLTDRIPDDFPMDNVGFHPEYENENWTAYKDHRVQFERTLEPNESLTTVYGIRLSNWSDAEQFHIEPELEEVTPVTDDAEGQGEERVEEHTITDIVSEDSSQVVRDVITGDSGLPGLDESESNDDAADPLAPDGNYPLASTADAAEADPLADASERDAASADEADDSTEPESEDDFDQSPLDDAHHLDDATDGSFDEPVNEPDAVAGGPKGSDDIIEAPDETANEPPASPPRPGSVAAALADEIRAGEANDDDLELIQQELDLDTPESTNVRIRHLQSRVDDLAAYTEALAEFIDDNGTAETLIDGFETDVESVRAELDAMDDELEDLWDDFETVGSLEGRIETLSDDVSELSDSVSATETRMDESVETLRSDIENIRSELTELHEWRD